MIDRNYSRKTNRQERYEYDGSGYLIYAADAPQGAASTDTTWFVNKYTNDGSGNPTLKQTSVGAWDSRASITYS